MSNWWSFAFSKSRDPPSNGRQTTYRICLGQLTSYFCPVTGPRLWDLSTMTAQCERSVPALDGGWGWVIVLCSFLNMALMTSIFFSFSVVFVELVEVFAVPTSTMAFLGSIQASMAYGFSKLDFFYKETFHFPLWSHQTETFSVLLSLCTGSPPVTGGFPTHLG